MPVAGENDAMRDTAGRDAAAARRQAACDALEAATRTWVEQTNDDDTAAAATEAEAEAARRSAADELVAASKALDRFVRARTLYHRMGVIGDDLTVDWNRS
ncbi:phosphatidylinositol transfer protein csr1 [Coemansia sp. RSA 2603]|nr:phosphatidylinositol transfer protein csr1 [Coemansia sp. RSA 2603]